MHSGDDAHTCTVTMMHTQWRPHGFATTKTQEINTIIPSIHVMLIDLQHHHCLVVGKRVHVEKNFRSWSHNSGRNKKNYCYSLRKDSQFRMRSSRSCKGCEDEMKIDYSSSFHFSNSVLIFLFLLSSFLSFFLFASFSFFFSFFISFFLSFFSFFF